MKSNYSELCIFFSDGFIGYYVQGEFSKRVHFGEVKMTKGVIHNGYIIEPTIILEKLKSAFKQSKIRPNHIRMVIHEQNIIIREIVIEKATIEKMDLYEYIQSQVGKAIQTPFKKPALTYHIKEETDIFYKLILFIVDENLLYDYLDLFRYLKVKEVTFELPSFALYKMIHASISSKRIDIENSDVKPRKMVKLKSVDSKEENLLIVSLYDQGLSLRIIDDNLPVFGLIEEYEGSVTSFYDTIDNYIDRIQNYYTFNLKKGTKNIENIYIFNFSDRVESEVLNKKIKEHNETPVHFFHIEDIDAQLSNIPKSCYMAYGASIVPSIESPQLKKTDFKLKFNQKTTQYMHYLLSLSVAIFSSISLIYIPYATMKETINIKEGINNSLKTQLEIIQSEISLGPIYTRLERDYSSAYEFLSQTEFSHSNYIDDLHRMLREDLRIVTYQIDSSSKKITFIIQSQDSMLMRDFIVDIYENYGITQTQSEDRWMSKRPESKDMAPTFLEVTVYYA
jgi:hypothetical protein